ncbi:MAG: hypothetical protein IVW53_15380 [Chloroflexi bacterium]|nr:hypothetical protein [Chloroflexota bacterium]
MEPRDELFAEAARYIRLMRRLTVAWIVLFVVFGSLAVVIAIGTIAAGGG